jgi:hypothetical protein
MLSKSEIEKLAENYLIQKGCPIVRPGRVTLPEKELNIETKKYLLTNDLAAVSFKSKYLDDPEHELDPGLYLVFVNIITGEVDMPRPM